MYKDLINFLEKKKILILGFGREGKASLKFLSSILPIKQFTVSDKSPEVLKGVSKDIKRISGENYLSFANDFDLIIKTPGIPSRELLQYVDAGKITSQTDLFLKLFSKQVIGITGTKGKSTTSSLLNHILKNAGLETLLVGNIGIPPFEVIERITKQTKIVFELSSHQLEFVNHSPHIAILLNLFQEHLDHYIEFKAYQLAKLNIAKYQYNTDYFYINSKDKRILSLLNELEWKNVNCVDFSFEDDKDTKKFTKVFLLNDRKNLPGDHNLQNIKVVTLIDQDHPVNHFQKC